MKHESRVGCAIFFSLFFGLIAVALIVGGIETCQQAKTTQDVPEPITARKLIEQGVGSNRHVLISEFQLLADDVIYSLNSTNVAWIPLAAKTETKVNEKYALILEYSLPDQNLSLEELTSSDFLQAIVLPDNQKLDEEIQLELLESSPDLNYQNSPLLKHVKLGSTPPTAKEGLIFFGIGLGIVCCCLTALIVTARGLFRSIRKGQEISSHLTDEDDVAWWKGQWNNGFTIQEGLIILRPDQVAFLPTEKKINVAATLAQTAITPLLKIDTLSLDPLRPANDLDSIVAKIWLEQQQDFDACIHQMVTQSEGIIWSRNNATVVRNILQRMNSRQVISFQSGKEKLWGFTVTSPSLSRVLQDWPIGFQSYRNFISLFSIVALLPTIAAIGSFALWWNDHDIPLTATYIWGGIALLMWSMIPFGIWVDRRQKKRLQISLVRNSLLNRRFATTEN